MTLESFRRDIVSIAGILVLQGLPNTMEKIIYWQGDWHHKYAETLLGVFDA